MGVLFHSTVDWSLVRVADLAVRFLQQPAVETAGWESFRQQVVNLALFEPIFQGVDWTADPAAALREIESRLQASPLLPRFHPLSPHPDLSLGSWDGQILSLRDINSYDPKRFGFKACRLAEIMQLGMPVPEGIVVSTACVARLLKEGKSNPHLIDAIVWYILQQLALIGIDPYGEKAPIVSVRTGAWKVMAGVLPSIQYVGLNAGSAQQLSRRFEDEAGVERLMLRFIKKFSVDVSGVPPYFLKVLEEELAEGEDWGEKIQRAKWIHLNFTKSPFPETFVAQLWSALWAVAQSWEGEPARDHRRLYGIEEDPPTAIVVQAQKFGALGVHSAGGVAYTRDPKTGDGGDWGLMKFQAGADEVMTGSRRGALNLWRFLFLMEELRDPIREGLRRLEEHYHGPQEVELVVEQGAWWGLQSDPLEPWPMARVRVAVAMRDEGLVTDSEAVAMVGKATWLALASPRYVRHRDLLAGFLLNGKTLVPGIGSGPIHHDLRALRNETLPPQSVVLVVPFLEPEDWDWALRVAAAIIFTEHPPAHFLPRALQRGVPMMLSRGDSAGARKEITEGTTVWVDATHEDAWLSDIPTTEKLGERARFLREELALKEVKGGQSQKDIATIFAFRAIEARHEAALQAAPNPDLDSVVQQLLEQAHWSKSLLEGVIDANRWGRQIRAPLHLARHDADAPTVDDFVYDLKAEWVGPFVTRLLREDTSRPKKLAVAFVETDHHEHALMLHLFGLLDDSDKGAFLNEYVTAAREMGRKPGRPSGIYLLSRMIAALMGDQSRGLPILNQLEGVTFSFLVEELYEFYQTLEGNAVPSTMEFRNQMEVEGIRLRNPHLGDKGELMDFLQSGVSAGRIEGFLAEVTVDPKVRRWFGGLVGAGDRVAGLLAAEAARNRPAEFNPNAFWQGLNSWTTPEEVARAVAGSSPAIPDISYVLEVMTRRGWASSTEGSQFVTALFTESSSLLTHWMIRTNSGQHSMSIALFEGLPAGLKVDLMDCMAAAVRAMKQSPGWRDGIFLLSRFLARLVEREEGYLEVVAALQPTTMAFIIEELFIFHVTRGSAGQSNDAMQQAYCRFVDPRYLRPGGNRNVWLMQEDQEYLDGVMERYPGLSRDQWGPRFKALPAERLEAITAPLDPAVREWFLRNLA